MSNKIEFIKDDETKIITSQENKILKGNDKRIASCKKVGGEKKKLVTIEKNNSQNNIISMN
jgi:uncharacterized protein YbcV (DUF1398 family)